MEEDKVFYDSMRKIELADIYTRKVVEEVEAGKNNKGIFGPIEEALKEANRIADENAQEHKMTNKVIVEEDILEEMGV